MLPAVIIGGLTSCGDLPTAPVSIQVSLPGAQSDVSRVPIPGQYIVRFRLSSTDALSNAKLVQSAYGGTVERLYSSAINGAAMKLADDAAAALRADPRVLSVEQDEVFTASGVTTQPNATWGLDRIDQRQRPLGGSYVYSADGSGVTVYIIDTGINFTQSDFGGRAQTGYDAITPGGNASDCYGHGSHVAGTVGSTTYGVAKNVRLVAVRVLDCAGNGSTSSVLAGIDWVTTNATKPAVANMSLGAAYNATVNQAVETSILSGVVYTISAGNSAIDACTYSPASAPNAITVGATDSGDSFASFSNFGACVDILAPGVGITSWWLGTGSNTISGTSMSAPHVAGAAALYLQSHPTSTPAQVRDALVSNGTSGVVTGLYGGTPNVLLYTGFLTAPPPTANFTSSCVSTLCSFDASSSTSASPSPTYAWTFGDGGTASGKTSTHTYANSGTFTVKLTITDPNGSSSKTSTVIVNRPPSAIVTAPAANATFTLGSSVTFAGTGTDPEDGALTGASLVWTSSIDGQIGAGVSFATVGLSAGTHLITLTATDSRNATGVATVTITINRPPSAAIATPTNGASVLLGAAVNFSGTGTDPEDGALTGASLVWTSSINGQIGTGTSLSTSALSAGTHTITLTVKDAQNVTGSATLALTVNRAPTASISAPASNASFARGVSVTFSGTGTDPEDGALTGGSLVWKSSVDGLLGTGATFSTVNLSVGTHVITLTATDAGNASGAATRTIIIIPASQPPVARFTATCPTMQCTFDASASTDDVGITRYAWTWGDGRSEAKTYPTTRNTWATQGVYTVTLTVTDGGGQTNTVSKQIAVPN